MARTQPSALAPTGVGTIIGPEIRVLGRVTGQEDLHVQGRIDGSIALTETLFVAPGGVVAAEVEALNVVVSGVLVGNVTARDCVTLNPGAKLVGDITAPRLIIADGAAFKGNVHMSGDVDETGAARSAARARPAPPTRRTAAPERVVAPPARRVPPRAEPRAAEVRPTRVVSPPAPAESADDEPTVIIRHSALAQDGGKPDGREPAAPAEVARFRGVPATRSVAPPREEAAAAPVASKNKLPARARIPKPGKRRVNRR